MPRLKLKGPLPEIWMTNEIRRAWGLSLKPDNPIHDSLNESHHWHNVEYDWTGIKWYIDDTKESQNINGKILVSVPNVCLFLKVM